MSSSPPDPFPYRVGEFFDFDLLARVADQVPDRSRPEWRRYGGEHEAGKWEASNPSMWGPAAFELVGEIQRTGPALGVEVLGVEGLTVSTFGGGYHWIEPGGALDLHVDFNRHPDRSWRRGNLLIYLNHDWTDEGGWLELADDEGVVFDRVAPEFGTCVLMESSERSWHGHPKPADRWRLSFAAYLFSVDAPPDPQPYHTTIYR